MNTQNRREFLKTSALGASMWLMCGHLNAAERSPRKKPNIIYIYTDQQSAAMMSCSGYKWLKTPAMDAIARNGVRFTRAYVNYPVCLPERYTMYTGRLPCTRRQADLNNKPTISLGNQARQTAVNPIGRKILIHRNCRVAHHDALGRHVG